MMSRLLEVLVFLISAQLAVAFLKENVNRVIIDVDAGVDDYQALVILLDAHINRSVHVEGIICTNGNAKVKDVEKNVLRLLDTARLNSIPIYGGSHNPILPHEPLVQWFGKDGFGDLNYTVQPHEHYVRHMSGPEAIKKIVLKYPKQVTIIAVGPLTNVALAIDMYENVAENIKEIFIMGGNYGVNEVEYNFLGDPEGAHIVLQRAKCPITIFTWQACISEIIPYKWFFNISDINNPVWNLNHRAEAALYDPDWANDMWNRCDAILSAIFLQRNIIKEAAVHNITVELHDSAKRGQIIDTTTVSNNVNVINVYDAEKFKVIFKESFRNICKYEYMCRDIY